MNALQFIFILQTLNRRNFNGSTNKNTVHNIEFSLFIIFLNSWSIQTPNRHKPSFYNNFTIITFIITNMDHKKKKHLHKIVHHIRLIFINIYQETI